MPRASASPRLAAGHALEGLATSGCGWARHRLRELRLASLADRHLLLQSVTLTSEDYTGKVSIDAMPTGSLTLMANSGIEVIMAVRIRLHDPGGPRPTPTTLSGHPFEFEMTGRYISS